LPVYAFKVLRNSTLTKRAKLKTAYCEIRTARATLPRLKTIRVEFIVATASINRYGFRLDLSGAKLDGFLKNPVLLYGHDRSELPIGRWENLRIDGDRMLATPVFDEEDEFAQQVKGKVERGILSAASVAFDPLVFSEQPDDLMPGQARATVKEWELLEISIVDIPGDRNAVRLSNGKDLEAIPMLSARTEESVSINPQPKMEKVTQALGLAAGATEEQMVSAIQALRSNAVASLLAVGESKGVVNEANRAQYERLAKADFEAVQLLFNSATAPAKTEEKQTETKKTEEELTLTGLIKQLSASQKPAGDNSDSWSFDEWSKNDSAGLLRMKREEPQRYAALAQAKAKASNVITD
jgi:HK97 family phage prohead protease